MNQPLKQFNEFPNILIHSGEYTSKNGSSEVTFKIENYQWEITLLLSKLRWKWTGWAVLCEILRNSPRKMVIQPYLDGLQSLSPTDSNSQAIDKLKSNFNAFGGGDDIAKSTSKGATALACSGPFQNQSIGIVGIGGGSEATINFTPTMWNQSDIGAALGTFTVGAPGVAKDEVLLHEMIHGMRSMAATFLCSATPDNNSLDTVEEFMAIVISNVYRSELGFSDLRADHRGVGRLNLELTNPQRFIEKDRHLPTNNYNRLIQLKKEHPKLCEDLKKVPASFNPFKLI